MQVNTATGEIIEEELMEPTATAGELVIVTGMTGAGRSTAAKELEDLGFFVVDNLPPTLVRDVVRLVDDSRGVTQPIAVVVDVRSGSFFDSLQANRHQGVTGRPTTLLFLEATDDVLVRRQEAARRPHPLQGSGRLLHGLQREREVLAEVRGDADVVIDTTNLNVHQLTDRIAEQFGTPESTALKVTVISFGFKYGIPVDADFVADMRFLPNPFWVPELRPRTGQRRGRRRLRQAAPERADVPRPVRPDAGERRRRLPHRGQALHDRRHRLHGRQAPQRGHDRGDRGPAQGARHRHPRQPPRPRAGVTARWLAATAQSAVALGGGHGLFASLSALRHLVADLTLDELTAVVTVADNGGSSGRLRGEFGVLPPGDLRMALAALCGDDEWGRTWAEVVQHRFAGEGDMRGHVIGNLLIVGMWELMGDPVRALDWVGRLLGARGRVLPMAITPIDMTADVRGLHADDPTRTTAVRGQVEVATTEGQIVSVALDPPDPQACAEAIDAVLAADWVVLGPGSWFTSVIPHLMVPVAATGPDRHRRPARRRAQPRAPGGGDPGLRTGGPPRGAVRARSRPQDPHRAGRRARRRRIPRSSSAFVSSSGATLVIADIAADGRHRPARRRQAGGRLRVDHERRSVEGD